MAQPPVAQRLMDQMDLMGKLQAKLEAAGKMMSKADKNKIMAIENEKLEALKQEQFALQAPRVAPDEEGQPPTWDGVMNAQSSKKKRADYQDYPCSKYASDPSILKHGTYTTFNVGREIIRQRIQANTLYLDMPQTKEALTQRMGGRVGGAGAPANGYLDWEFNDGRGIRCVSMIDMILI